MDMFASAPYFPDDWEVRRARGRAYAESAAAPSPQTDAPQPVDTSSRSYNPLRPRTFEEVIGQERVKQLLARMVEVARDSGRPLGHVLLVGPSGTGKTTFAHVIAAVLGTRVFQIEAPISHDTLLSLRDVMQDGDVLFVDEIHQQAIMERRGRQAATQPEVLFGVMEDRVLATQAGILPFPHITMIGGTTDEGLLPDAFINRFPLRPRLEPYSIDNLMEIAWANGDVLGVDLNVDAALTFAKACRGVPREINNYVRACQMLGRRDADRDLATEVVTKLNSCTLDGLTLDMQRMLTFIYTSGKQVRQADGAVSYRASVQSIAVGIGKSRDVKSIVLRVEPYLIERGYVHIGGRGRELTEAGIQRARQLLEGDPC